MIAPSLVHIEYIKDLDGTGSREHSVYIPLRGYESKASDQVHFTLQVEAEAREQTAQSQSSLRVSITPKEPLTVTSCRILFTGAFSSYEKALFNGYQSWTDTREVDLYAAQRGLVGTPKRIIDRFVLDGAGDYRFHRYTNKPGNLHGWTYAYFVGTPGIWMIGSLSYRCGFTLLEWTAAEGLNVVPEPPARELGADERVVLADLLVLSSEPQESGNGEAPMRLPDWALATWLDHAGVFPRAHRLLAGYSSRYRSDKIDEVALLADLEGAKAAFAKLNADKFTRVFLVDAGVSPVGDWMLPSTDRFPSGMASLTAHIRDAGFTPALWMAPFVCEKNSELYRGHPAWILRDGAGDPVRTGNQWSGAVALDTLNPEVHAYLTTCLRTAVGAWGFRMLKLDFLFAACMVPHGGKNRGELMADAMGLIREAVGDEVLVDVGGVPLASAFGVADFCRIGCDVGSEWDSPLYQRIAERERTSTKNSLFNTVYRAPLDGRAFGNDPDVVMLRAGAKYTDGQREMVLFGAACHTSVLLASDDLGTWTPDQLASYQEALDLMRASHPEAI